jgi:glycosyltransferase involved in cell wall biosynthesis
MPDFEVIVSDNDPEASSRIIVEEMKDSRFRYFYNTENLGMIKNFSKALENATGEFVVMITVDILSALKQLRNLRLTT